jgi:hypothetical protein
MSTKMTQEGHKQAALTQFTLARTTNNTPVHIKRARSHLKKGKSTLFDIKMNEGDIERILRDYYKREASLWLKLARTTGVTLNCIRYMKTCLQKGNWNLIDIDTDDNELSELLKNPRK